MKGSKVMAMAIVGLMIMLSGISMVNAYSISTNHWDTTYQTDGQEATIEVSIGDFSLINSATVGNGRYYGPTFSVTETHTGVWIIFVRNDTSHVGNGTEDMGDIEYLKSSDHGATWSNPVVLVNGSSQNLDIGEATAGTTPSGRVICVYYKFDCINYTRDPQEADLAYKYSDDNGVTFSTEKMLYPVVNGTNITHISAPHGNIGTYDHGRIGFTFFSLKQSPNLNSNCKLGFAYSDDNGNTWHYSQISDRYFVNEATVVNVGNYGLVAMARTNNGSGDMFTSLDNGATWTYRGSTLINAGAGCPILMGVLDNWGQTWVLRITIYNTYFYSIANGKALIDHGVSAWKGEGTLPADPPIVQFNESDGTYDDFGQTGYFITRSNGEFTVFTCYSGGGFNVASASYLSWHEIDVRIHIPGGPGSIGLPANVHQYTTLVLVMFGLVMVMTTVGFMSKAKDKGITKDDVIELVVFLVVSLILMGVLVVMLGS